MTNYDKNFRKLSAWSAGIALLLGWLVLDQNDPRTRWAGYVLLYGIATTPMVIIMYAAELRVWFVAHRRLVGTCLLIGGVGTLATLSPDVLQAVFQSER